jgi:signal transduction histidine kinase
MKVALDADHLFQVAFNLCLNAVEAQKDGGEITVRILPSANGARADGVRKILLEIEDRGTGVPPEAAARVFDPFFTTKSESGGSGLGLAIVSGIVREAGGTVELASNSEKGSCFRVALPSDGSWSRPATTPEETDR